VSGVLSERGRTDAFSFVKKIHKKNNAVILVAEEVDFRGEWWWW